LPRHQDHTTPATSPQSKWNQRKRRSLGSIADEEEVWRASRHQNLDHGQPPWRRKNMGAHFQVLSAGRGTLLLPPRLEGTVPAGEQQPNDSKYPKKYTRPTETEHRHHHTSHAIACSHRPSMSRSPVTQATRRCPHQGSDTHGAATAKSKNLGFHPGA
jgi:hypothetical protein